MDAVGPWTLGWDALLAIATFFLAVVTVIVALVTNRVARATGEEVQSQSLPILLPDELDSGRAIEVESDCIRLKIQNGGNGPAFKIRCELDLDGLKLDAWSRGILERGDSTELYFRGSVGEPRSEYLLKLECLDLAGRPHSSKIVIRLGSHWVGAKIEQDYVFHDVDISRGGLTSTISA